MPHRSRRQPDRRHPANPLAAHSPEPGPRGERLERGGMNPHLESWREVLAGGTRLAGATGPFQVSGRLTRINGLVMEAAGLKLPLGSACRIVVPGGSAVEAEVRSEERRVGKECRSRWSPYH